MFVFTAGYRMMSVLNPELCRKVTLRHCVSLVVLSRCYQCVTSQHGGRGGFTSGKSLVYLVGMEIP